MNKKNAEFMRQLNCLILVNYDAIVISSMLMALSHLYSSYLPSMNPFEFYFQFTPELFSTHFFSHVFITFPFILCLLVSSLQLVVMDWVGNATHG